MSVIRLSLGTFQNSNNNIHKQNLVAIMYYVALNVVFFQTTIFINKTYEKQCVLMTLPNRNQTLVANKTYEQQCVLIFYFCCFVLHRFINSIKKFKLNLSLSFYLTLFKILSTMQQHYKNDTRNFSYTKYKSNIVFRCLFVISFVAFVFLD